MHEPLAFFRSFILSIRVLNNSELTKVQEAGTEAYLDFLISNVDESLDHLVHFGAVEKPRPVLSAPSRAGEAATAVPERQQHCQRQHEQHSLQLLHLLRVPVGSWSRVEKVISRRGSHPRTSRSCKVSRDHGICCQTSRLQKQ